MTVYIWLELMVCLLSVDERRHAIFSFIKQCQYSLINIVVDKDNTFLRTLNQVGHESVGIINLPIVEHTPASALRCSHPIYETLFFYTLVGFLQVLLHFQLMVLHSREVLKHFGIVL